MITNIKQGHTIVPVYTGPGEPGDRAAALQLINRCVRSFAIGMHTADNATLAHEAERLEALAWTSPAITRMRRIVAAEQRQRAGREVASHA